MKEKPIKEMDLHELNKESREAYDQVFYWRTRAQVFDTLAQEKADDIYWRKRNK